MSPCIVLPQAIEVCSGGHTLGAREEAALKLLTAVKMAIPCMSAKGDGIPRMERTLRALKGQKGVQTASSSAAALGDGLIQGRGL